MAARCLLCRSPINKYIQQYTTWRSAAALYYITRYPGDDEAAHDRDDHIHSSHNVRILDVKQHSVTTTIGCATYTYNVY